MPETGDSQNVDPFDELRLDDEFVRSATAHEPAHRTRDAIARLSPQTTEWRSAPTYGKRRRAGNWPRRRRTLSGVALLAVVVIGVILAMRVGPLAGHTLTPAVGDRQLVAPQPVHATAPVNPTLIHGTYVVGACYTWNQRAVQTDVLREPCSGPHLFEYVSTVTLTDYTFASPYPTAATITQLMRADCTAPDTAFLHYPLYPDGRFSVGVIFPTAPSWRQGDRAMNCGMQGNPAVGTTPPADELPVITVAVQGAPQSNLFPVGECVQISAGGSSSRVACASPHNTQVTGVGVTQGVDADPLGVADFQAVATKTCNSMASAFLGRHFTPTSRTDVGWYSIAATDWRDGERSFNCTLEYYSAKGIRVDVIGSANTPTATVGA